MVDKQEKAINHITTENEQAILDLLIVLGQLVNIILADWKTQTL